MQRKTGKILAVALMLALSVLSIHTLIFSARLFRLSFASFLNEEKENETLAKNYLRNKRLAPLVRDEYMKSENFLASFLAEMIADDKVHLLKKEYQGLINKVIERFPENLFLAHFGFYGEEDPAIDWENFDALSLKLMREARFRSLVFSLLTEKIVDQEIPESSLPLLISYLNWMKNFSLAEDLLSWALAEKKMGSDVYDSLLEDLNRRKRCRSTSKGRPVEASGGVSFLIPFEYKNIKAEAGRNLLFDRNLRTVRSQKRAWKFSDISDTEQYAKGSFYGHSDSCENNRLRVMGFFIKYSEGKGYARGSLQLKKEILMSEGTYLFHFRYKTSSQSEIPSFWLGRGIEKMNRLEPAEADWKDMYYIFNNSHYKLTQAQPLLRMFGTGSVWFENIGFYRIELGGIKVEQDALIIQ